MRTITLLVTLLFACLSQAQEAPDKLLKEADLAYKAANYGTALNLLDSLIARDATIAQAYKLRGDARQRTENIEGALEDYETSRKLDSKNARLYVSRSAARITQGNMNAAIKDLERAIKLAPDDADIYYNMACARYMQLDNKSALRALHMATDLNNDHADAIFLRGVIRGEEYEEEEGLEDVQRALAMKPDIPGGRMAAGILLFELGKYDDAIAQFSGVITDREDGFREAHYFRAECRYELGDKETACKDWRVAGRLGDEDAQYIVKNYCETDATKLPRLRKKNKRVTTIQF